MQTKASLRNHVGHQAPETAFAFEPMRADRGSLGARRVDTPPTRDGALLLYRQAAGTCEFSAAGVRGRLLAGDMTMVDSASGVRFTGDVAAVERLIVPRSRLPASPEAIEAAHGRVIPARSPFGVVLGSLLDSVRAPGSTPPGCEASNDAVMRALFAAATSAAVEGAVVSSEGDPLVWAIRDYIETHLADARLSPDVIGRHFGLSRASLYRLWRPTGGIASYIRQSRLARADLYLRSARNRRTSIVEVAHHCGFNSVSSFGRLYRNRYGCTPNDTIAESIRKRSEVGQDGRPE